MELSDIKTRLFKIFNVNDMEELKLAVWRSVRNNNHEIFDAFVALNPKMDKDLMQPLFQYYFADRKRKSQDLTPPSLARLTALMAGDGDIVDLCAGTGSLSIQAWAYNHERSFELWEKDENIIPFLLFNTALRNMDAVVFHADVLTRQVYAKYIVISGKRYSIIQEVLHDQLGEQSTIQHFMDSRKPKQGTLLSL